MRKEGGGTERKGGGCCGGGYSARERKDRDTFRKPIRNMVGKCAWACANEWSNLNPVHTMIFSLKAKNSVISNGNKRKRLPDLKWN
jgi:hypothetical protein